MTNKDRKKLEKMAEAVKNAEERIEKLEIGLRTETLEWRKEIMRSNIQINRDLIAAIKKEFWDYEEK